MAKTLGQLTLSSFTPFTWKKGRELHRVHQARFAASSFNGTKLGNARFSPIYDTKGNVIPTIYAGTNFDCAAMETIFHNVPYKPGIKRVFRETLVGQAYSVLSPSEDLRLIDLSTLALRKLGIENKLLIDTTAAKYPHTRLWAEAFHRLDPLAQGIRWISRQNNQAEAVVLFGDRILPDILAVVRPPRDLLSDMALYADIQTLAQIIGVNLVDHKS